MVLHDAQYKVVWDWVYDTLHFNPSIDPDVMPFVISAPYVVFDIRDACDRMDEEAITAAMIRCLHKGEKLYALDWQHDCFLVDLTEHFEAWRENTFFDYPQYCPDGDYYFFIDEQFRFGYLGHPWRQEVWIFGERLIAEFEALYPQLGWIKKEVVS